MPNHTLPFALIFLSVFFGIAQPKLIINEEGLPPITHYPSSIYGGNDQVWDMIQDERGLIYITTTSSIHEYDGEEWRVVHSETGHVGMSFSKSNSGRIYVSGYNMMGYLEPDSLGKTSFVSLQDRIPEGTLFGIPGFNSAKGSQVAFSGTESIMIYNEQTDSIHSLNTKALSNFNFFIGSQPVFYLKGQGMVTMEADSFRVYESGDYFKDVAVSGVMSLTDSSIIVSTYFQGFHYFDQDTAYTISALTDSFYMTRYPRSIFRIGEDYFGITFLQGGLVILDSQFVPVHHFDKDNGLTNEMYSAFSDADGNLWLGSNEGLYMMDLTSAHYVIDKRMGLEGNITDVGVTDEDILLSGSQGIFKRSLNPDKVKAGSVVIDRSFKKVEGSQLYSDLMLTGVEPVLVKTGGTVGQIKDDKYEVILQLQTDQGYAMTFLKDSTLAIASGRSGKDIELFELQQENWTHIRSLHLDSLPDVIFKFLFDRQSDRVWGCSQTQLFSFNLSEGLDQIVDFQIYGLKDGLPETAQINVGLTGDRVVFPAGTGGLYHFEAIKEQFYKDDRFKDVFDSLGLVTITQQSPTEYWCSVGNYVKGKVTVQDGHAELDYGIGNVIPGNNSWTRYVDELGALLAGSTGLYVIQDQQTSHKRFSFPPLVRYMTLTNQMDTTVYYGGGLEEREFTLSPEQNSIRFEAAVPHYTHSEFTEYAYMLEPFEDSWSEWTSLNQKEYTNLPHGDYVFKVRSKNGYFEVSEVGTFEFEITKPWYLSAFAYGFYLIAFGSCIYLIIYLNSRRLKRENLRLEQIIEDRTREILNQKDVIQKSLEERESLLKEIHHRVKNNLQIIASLLYLQSGKFEDEDFKKVLEEGQGRVRSMALIHQKLYENEDLKSIPFEEYLQELLGEIRASFGVENVNLNIEAKDIQFDVETAVPLGLIVNELATNAFKYAFSDIAQGTFSIILKKEGGQFQLTVSDNGQGIPDKIDIRKTKSLGLRLVKMLSVQLEGDYEFQTENGTKFNLKFAA